MRDIGQLHQEAMDLVDRAHLARLRGQTDTAANLTRQSFEKEREAALLVSASLDFEPSRSVLLRSAASLALQCDETREAERLIGLALSGRPPDEIAEELRDLLEQVHFHRHLAIKGVSLEGNEIQLSIAGKAVGLGIAHSSEFIGRVKDLESLIYRTAERIQDRPFRDRPGPVRAAIKKQVEVYVTVPRAASLAVSIRLGRALQTQLPGMDLPRDIIDEVLNSLELFSESNLEDLRSRFPDEPYYNNFMGLAKKLAPDGESVQTVGLTTVRAGRERRVALTVPRRELPRARIPPEEGPEYAEVRGVLELADARDDREGRIEVIDDEGNRHLVRVPPGMMGDIVRPMFEYEVRVTGPRDHRGIIALDNIEPVEE